MGNINRLGRWFMPAALLIAQGICKTAQADDTSAGVNGINSRNLSLTGAGTYIGQVELGRPGERLSIPADTAGEWYWDYGADGMPGTADAGEGDGVYTAGETFVDLSNSGNPGTAGAYDIAWRNNHPDVSPYGTFVLTNAAPPRAPILNSVGPSGNFFMSENYYNVNYQTAADHQVDGHAESVAGVMISNGAADKGVAAGTRLYSGAFFRGANNIGVTTENVLRQVLAGGISNVRAVNHSWGFGPSSNDGSSVRTLMIDYFGKKYDSLQVIAGDEAQAPPSEPGNPSDLYNGINVSMLQLDGGQFTRYSGGNRYVAPASGRINVQLAAPGININMPQLGGTGYATSNGTSFAAPHVTATVALLQEYGDVKRAASAPGWDSSARRHEVMKAVLLNSADKVKDDGTIVPVGNLLGMEKTIFINSAGGNTWLDSAAYTSGAKPLDDHVGAGALNANRAKIQYAAGEFDPGMIPTIGWDDQFIAGGQNDYFFNASLPANSFISATLCWDRDVTLNDTNSDGLFTPNETFTGGSLLDLDLSLWLKDGSNVYSLLTDFSNSSVDSTEHIFFKLTTTGDYMLRVAETGSSNSIEYGLAWWAVPEPGCAALLLVASIGVMVRRRRV